MPSRINSKPLDFRANWQSWIKTEREKKVRKSACVGVCKCGSSAICEKSNVCRLPLFERARRRRRRCVSVVRHKHAGARRQSPSCLWRPCARVLWHDTNHQTIFLRRQLSCALAERERETLFVYTRSIVAVRAIRRMQAVHDEFVVSPTWSAVSLRVWPLILPLDYWFSLCGTTTLALAIVDSASNLSISIYTCCFDFSQLQVWPLLNHITSFSSTEFSN